MPASHTLHPCITGEGGGGGGRRCCMYSQMGSGKVNRAATDI